MIMYLLTINVDKLSQIEPLVLYVKEKVIPSVEDIAPNTLEDVKEYLVPTKKNQIAQRVQHEL